jgi:hypothetical protein
VLVGLADRHHRQKRGRQIRWQAAQDFVDDALVDAGIDPDRQMRPMLLDGGDRQHRNRPLRVERGKVRGRHLVP